MNKNPSAFVVGFGAGVLLAVPFVKSFSCCLILPVAGFLVLTLDQKARGDYSQLTINKVARLSITTGLWAALFGTFFDLLITFITHTNDVINAYGELQSFVSTLPLEEAVRQQVSALLEQVISQIRENGFSWLYSFSTLVNNLITDTIFAFIGGAVGMKILNSRNQE